MPFFNLPQSGSGGGGSSTLSGSGAPANTLGVDGQLYIDTASKTLYGPKQSGSWGSGIALTGASWAELTGKPSTFAPSPHQHPISDVTSLQSSLDGKAASSHTHTIANVTGLQSAIDGKASAAHQHPISDVTGLQSALDAKQPTISSFVASVAGRSGAVTLTASDVGLGSVNNTTDANKPVSNLQAASDAAVQAFAIQRANHTGSQAISTVTGLQTALDGKQVAGSYATLVGGQVPASMLPSFVDDVVDVGATLPSVGETGKIYVVSTGSSANKIFRWSGSVYVEISPSPGTTTDVPEGSNLYFTNARASAAAPVQSVAGLTGAVTLTKTSVGLGNVDNTADASKPVSAAQAAADAVVQSFAIQRANHTGTQLASTISDLSTQVVKYAPVTSVNGLTGNVTVSGGALLSDATPSALGTASAGVALTASRSDHVHATPVISYSNLTNVPSTFAPSTHQHTIAEVTGLQSALDGKQVAGSYAAAVHAHAISDVTGLQAALDSQPSKLSDATPAALGTASSGTASTASRSDHVHTLPSLSTLGAAAANHAHPYVTAINDLNGALTLAAGNNVTLTVSGSTITIASTGGGGGGGDTDGGDYDGVVASISITQQPADVSVAINQGSNGSASFTVAASASTGVPVAYQWQQNTGSAWSSIDGGTSATLTRIVAASDNGNAYRCIVTAFDVPQVTSNSASLAVTVIVPSAPVITISSQPQSATILSTQSTASFSVSASATQSQAVAFQWQRRNPGATSWQSVSGATASTLSLTELSYDQDNGASYRVMVTASGASAVYSNTVSLAITWAASPRVTLAGTSSNTSLGSAGHTYYGGSNSTTDVTVADTIAGATTVAYRWEAKHPSYGTFSTQNFWQYDYGSKTSRTIRASRDLTGGNSYELRCVITATNSYGTTTVTTGTFTRYIAAV
jgi:hypothetical protein